MMILGDAPFIEIENEVHADNETIIQYITNRVSHASSAIVFEPIC